MAIDRPTRLGWCTALFLMGNPPKYQRIISHVTGAKNSDTDKFSEAMAASPFRRKGGRLALLGYVFHFRLGVSAEAPSRNKKKRLCCQSR
jgi:hypothetical protein